MNILLALFFIPSVLALCHTGTTTGTVRSLVSSMGWDSPVETPGVSAGGYTTKMAYACGINIGSVDWRARGIEAFKFRMCHLYDWGSQSDLTLLSSGSFNTMQMCPTGHFIEQIQFKEYFSSFTSGDDIGIFAVRFKCSDPFDTSTIGSASSWLYGDDAGFEHDGDWTGVYQTTSLSPPRYIVGAVTSHGSVTQCVLGICGSDGLGLAAFKVISCPVYCGESIKLKSSSVPGSYHLVDPPSGADPTQSATRAYSQTSAAWGTFSSYFDPISSSTGSNSNNPCRPYSCTLYKSCTTAMGPSDEAWFITDNPAQSASQDQVEAGSIKMLEVNTDPGVLFSVSVCVKCGNANVEIASNSFIIQTDCGSNIEIYEPPSLSYHQQGNPDPDPTNWPTFSFPSFQTKTKACPVAAYEVAQREASTIEPPYGVVVAAYDENPSSGTVSQNSFSIRISDGTNPYTYQFQIKAKSFITNGTTPSSLWAPVGSNSVNPEGDATRLSLTVLCPASVTLNPKTALSTAHYSYVGEPDAHYTFPAFESSLPKCSQVNGYSLVGESPPGKLTYPSKLCTSDPCLKVDIDSSTDAVVNFQIQVAATTGVTSATATITIHVAETPQTPTLTAPALPTVQILLDSTSPYTFSPFSCSTGCPITIYESTAQASTRGVPVAGIATAATYNSLTSKYELALSETSAKTTFQFYLYAASTAPAVSTFSDLVNVEVVCGSEQVTVPSSLKAQEFSPLAPSATGITYYDNLLASFSSTKPTRCPIARLELFSDEALTLAQDSDPILLLNGDSPSTAKIKLLHQTLKRTVYLRASTAQESATLISNYVALTFQVCGAEAIQAVLLSSQPSILTEFETAHNTIFDGWFSTSFDSALSHQACTDLSFSITQGASCTTPLSSALAPLFIIKQVVNSNYLEVTGAVATMQIEVCLVAQTVGKQIAFHHLLVEVCGSETITATPGTLSRTIPYSTTATVIDIKASGFQFFSDRANCPPRSFQLVEEDRHTVFSPSSHIRLEVSPSYELSILIDSSKPLGKRGLFIQGNSSSDGSSAYVPFEVEICGTESLTGSEKVQRYFEKEGSKEIEVLYAFYQGLFSSNSTTCPITEYSLRIGSLSVEAAFKLMFRDLEIESQVLISINPESKSLVLDPDLSAAFVEHQTSLTEPKTWFSEAITLSKEQLDIEFELVATSMGNKEATAKFKFSIIAEGEWSQRNFAPYFTQEVFPIQITVSEFQQEVFPGYELRTTLPSIEDPEGDPVQLEKKCSTRWILLGLMNTNTYEIKVSKRLITLDDQGELVCDFEISDDAGNYVNYPITFNVTFERALPSIEGMTFHLNVLNCKPFARILSYEFVCKASGFIQAICEVARDGFFILDHPTEKRAAVDYQAEVKKFNRQIQRIPTLMVYSQINVRMQMSLINDGLTDVARRYPGQAITPLEFGQATSKQYALIKGIQLMETENGTRYGVPCEATAAPKAMDIELNSGSVNVMDTLVDKMGLTTSLINKTTEVVCVEGQDCDEKIPLEVSSVRLGQDSMLTISFNQQLILPSEQRELEFIAVSHFKLWILSGKSDSTKNFGSFVGELEPTLIPPIENEGSADGPNVDDLGFQWTVESFKDTSLNIQLTFDKPDMISQSSEGRDRIVVEVTQNTLLFSFKARSRLEQEFLKEYSTTIFPRIKFVQFEKAIKAIAEKAKQAMVAMVAFSLVLTALQNKSMQDFWGMLNSQQVSIHLALIDVPNLPSNALVLQRNLKDLNQRDMYPTDLIYQKVFAFTETASLSDLFDEMGYEGGVFIALTGSLLINIILIFLEHGLSSSLNWIMKKNYKLPLARKIGSSLPETAAYQVLMKILVAGYLELAVCSFISVLYRSSDEETPRTTLSDGFDKVTAVTSLLFCLLLPLYFYFVITRSKRKLTDPGFVASHGYMYEDLDTRSTASCLFNVFYMGRRLLFALILVSGRKLANFQLMAHIQLSMAYTGYLLGHRPFEDPVRSFKEAFNEVCIVMISDIYLVFKANTEKASQYQLGWTYICVYLTILVVNLWAIGKNILLQLVKAFRNGKAKLKVWKRERFEQTWVSRKKHFQQKFPLSKLNASLHTQVDTIISRRKEIIEIEAKMQKLLEEKQWLTRNDLPEPEVNLEINQLRLIYEHRHHEDLSLEAAKEAFVALPLQNMLGRRFLHNSIRRADYYEQVQPYSEAVFNEVLERAWAKFKDESSLKRWEQATSLVLKSKVQVLWDYLRFKRYLVARFPKNPEQENWLQAIALLSEADPSEIATELPALARRQGFLKTPTRREQIDIVVKLYEVPTVVLSGSLKMSFFDEDLAPTAQVSDEVIHPLYLLEQFSERKKRNPKYMVLVHPKHTRFLELLKTNKIALTKFDPPKLLDIPAFLSPEAPEALSEKKEANRLTKCLDTNRGNAHGQTKLFTIFEEDPGG